MKIGNVHISIMAQKEGDNSAIVTTAKRALLYLLLRLGLRNVSTRIFNKQKFKLLPVLLKRAYFPRIAVSHKCFSNTIKKLANTEMPCRKESTKCQYCIMIGYA